MDTTIPGTACRSRSSAPYRSRTVASTPPVSHSDHSTARRAWQDGQKTRVLQERATRNSHRQAAQRTRAKPRSSAPQSRKKIRPVVFRVMPLAEVARAHQIFYDRTVCSSAGAGRPPSSREPGGGGGDSCLPRPSLQVQGGNLDADGNLLGPGEEEAAADGEV